MRVAKRHQPPSRLRYEAANPVIGVRLDRATYERLLKLREETGLSFGALFRDALGVVEKDVEVIRQHARAEGVEIGRKIGRNEGYKEAVAKYGIMYLCSDCGEEIKLLAGSKSAAAASEALTELGWGHASCHRRTRGS
jgi:Ribbon-helix-helix protein, copG family